MRFINYHNTTNTNVGQVLSTTTFTKPKGDKGRRLDPSEVHADTEQCVS